MERKSITMTFNLGKNAEDIISILSAMLSSHATINHIESRSNKNTCNLDLYVQTSVAPLEMENMLKALKMINSTMVLYEDERCPIEESSGIVHVPWFPRHISELDKISKHVYMYGSDLDADHPSFKDPEYRKRRDYFTIIANEYKYGQPIPRIEYTEVERTTWKTIYCELTKLYETYACEEYLKNLKLLQLHAGYCESDLPQLEDVSRFLKRRTGFTLRPVAGYLSARDFLAGLAFRVFYCTQYIRHHSNPWYTPEPDCCHELLGHMPMFADPSFAQFSQEIGLASLGTSDEEVKKLATCYFFSVEFGLCRQRGQLKAYGAGLLSSAAELKHALSDKANIKPFIPESVMKEECMVTTYQNGYFETPSFEDATYKMRKFARTIQRPFDVVYNPYTESVHLVSNLHQTRTMIEHVGQELSALDGTIEKLSKLDVSEKESWVMDELDETKWPPRRRTDE